MELIELQKLQRKFDEEHFPRFWKDFWKKKPSDKELLDKLLHLTIALVGECGEFANVVKKIDREFEHQGEKISEEKLQKLKEELVDILIYVLIIANVLNMNLEEEYLRKRKINEKRFERFKS